MRLDKLGAKFFSNTKSQNNFLYPKPNVVLRQKFVQYSKLYPVFFFFLSVLTIYKPIGSKEFDKGFYFTFLTANGVQ
jgi:hypothetical protein